jgi:hypothetical protein
MRRGHVAPSSQVGKRYPIRASLRQAATIRATRLSALAQLRHDAILVCICLQQPSPNALFRHKPKVQKPQKPPEYKPFFDVAA